LSFNGNQYPSDEGLDLTTKGQIHTHDTSANAALNVGSNTYLLTADSTETTGMKWAASAGGATVTTQSIFFTGGSTTTSTSLVDVPNSTITLPTRSGGFAFISVQLTCENTVSTAATQIGTYKNSADSIQSCNEQNAVNTANTINVSDSDDLDGGSLKARWSTESGTTTLSQSSGSGRSLMRTFEVS